MRTLWLLRHAKSSWDDPSSADHDRLLAPRGRRAVGLLADHVTRSHIRPELALCSTAARAHDTVRPLLDALGDPALVLEAGLYHASGPSLLGRLRAVPDEVESVLLVGHEPGLGELVRLLVPPGGLRSTLDAKFPTGALATIELDARWDALGSAEARLVGLWTPRAGAVGS